MVNGYKIGEKPVRGVASIFLLIDESRVKLDVATATLNFLFKPYRILDNQCSVFVAKFWNPRGDGKMFGVAGRLNTCTKFFLH